MSEGLQAVLDDAWTRIEAGAADPDAPARFCVLATAEIGGGARARMVVLRAADRSEGMLQVHTDLASAKVEEIETDPYVTFLFWDPADQVQIRVEAIVLVEPGGADAWDRLPDHQRRAYGGTPPPGETLHAPEAHDPTPDPSRFGILTATAEAIEVLRLGPEHHARARFEALDTFAGRWIAP